MLSFSFTDTPAPAATPPGVSVLERLRKIDFEGQRPSRNVERRGTEIVWDDPGAFARAKGETVAAHRQRIERELRAFSTRVRIRNNIYRAELALMLSTRAPLSAIEKLRDRVLRPENWEIAFAGDEIIRSLEMHDSAAMISLSEPYLERQRLSAAADDIIANAPTDNPPGQTWVDGYWREVPGREPVMAINGDGGLRSAMTYTWVDGHWRRARSAR